MLLKAMSKINRYSSAIASKGKKEKPLSLYNEIVDKAITRITIQKRNKVLIKKISNEE